MGQRVFELIFASALLTSLQQAPAGANPLIPVKKIVDYVGSLRGDRVDELVDLFARDPQSYQQKYGESEILNLVNADVKELVFLKYDLLSIFEIDESKAEQDSPLAAKVKSLLDKVNLVLSKFSRFRSIAANDEHTPLIQDVNSAPLASYLTADVIERIHGYDEANSMVCDRNETMQQVVANYLETLVNADLRVLAMKIHVLGKGSDAQRKRDEVDRFVRNTDEAFQAVNKVLHRYPRDLWRCDPDVYERDVTYSKLHDVFQTFVNFEPDEDVLEAHYSKKCRHGCAIFNDTSKFYSVCKSGFCDGLPTKKRCTGHFRNCRDLSDGSINTPTTLCHSPADSERRYEWLETGGKRYGENRGHSCDPGDGFKRDERCNVRYDWGSSCRYCTCTCVINDEHVDRYFSLEPVVADVCRNRVVTGVRLEKREHTFHVRIQQGELGAHGHVDPRSVEWKRPEDSSIRYDLYTNTSRGYKQSQKDEYSYLNDTIFYENPYVYSVDYERRTFVFDEIEPRYGEGRDAVVTGLKFTQVKDYLRLQVQMTPFDYDSGKLRVDEAKWLPDLSEPLVGRTELNLEKANIPIEVKTEHAIDSSPSQFVKFQLTDLETDFGQTVVPFLDLQAVAPSVAAPLSGAGIVHRGCRGSGGFLAFKLVQFDFGEHLTGVSSLAEA